MKGTPAIYLGRIVDKKHFRTFVYGPNGEKKLVESWDAFEAAMESGIWFATVEDAIATKASADEPEDTDADPKAKPKPNRKPKPKPVAQRVEEDNDAEDVLPDDGSVFEVKDDFLPNESE